MKQLKKLILAITLTMLFLDAGAQQYCNANCNDTLRDESTIHYIPDEYTTMKYVKVNFHFMMKSDSTLNFRQYDDGNGNGSFTAYDYSELLIAYANSMLSQNDQMHLPPGNNTPILQRKYRLRLEDVYFHYDDYAYAFYNYPEELDDVEIAYYSENATSEINVFFVYNDNELEANRGLYGGDANMQGSRIRQMDKGISR